MEGDDLSGRTVWVTARDRSMFEWLSIVRITDVQSVRWVLAALNGINRPVSVRRAQSWCARMETAGLIERAQLGGRGGALVWGSYAGTGLSKPNLYRQTTRHEVAVAAASARYATAGYAWQRDEKPAFVGGHQADGVALGFGWVELIEVELTPKRPPRYSTIFTAYRRRLDLGEADLITYLCNDESARAVQAALAKLPAGRSIAPQIDVRSVYDASGIWADDALPSWMMTARDRARRSNPRPRPSSAAALF